MDKNSYQQLLKLCQKQIDELAMFYNSVLDITPPEKRNDVLKAFTTDLREASERHTNVFKILNK